MDIVPLPAEETAVRRYVEELWLPYNRELERVVSRFSLTDAPESELVAEELPFRLDRLRSDGYQLSIAVSGSHDEGLADAAGELVGFVATEVEPAPSVFDRPDRLLVCDIYVDAEHRGTGLAEELLTHATEHADEAGCRELTVEVDVDNDRALAFYRKLGFEPVQHTMAVDADAVR